MQRGEEVLYVSCCRSRSKKITRSNVIESFDKKLFAATNNSREMLDYKPVLNEENCCV